VKIDAGSFYASKDFYDPVKGRRINFGWATVPPASTQSLPREVTWHPELQQLVFSPLEEQDALRGAVIGSMQKKSLMANVSTPMGLPSQAGNQSEVRVSFDRPAAAARLSVNVMVDMPSSAKGIEFFVEYEPSVDKVQVGSGRVTDTLSLLPSDNTIDLTLYVDNTMTEAFWMGGRTAMTIVTGTSHGADDITFGASEPGAIVSATAWKVGSIWVTPDVVKQTPRRDSVPMVVV
jgi:sucrose-6-phosphate hydrolase SacC (GH32 family)